MYIHFVKALFSKAGHSIATCIVTLNTGALDGVSLMCSIIINTFIVGHMY